MRGETLIKILLMIGHDYTWDRSFCFTPQGVITGLQVFPFIRLEMSKRVVYNSKPLQHAINCDDSNRPS
jgi:hypothetical protein